MVFVVLANEEVVHSAHTNPTLYTQHTTSGLYLYVPWSEHFTGQLEQYCVERVPLRVPPNPLAIPK